MRKINLKAKSDFQQHLENSLEARLIGQERAVRYISKVLGQWEAGLAPLGRPVGNTMLLGPTGSGKTFFVEQLAEILLAQGVDGLIKIDCAEFQHGHEVAKLLGSPPGYLGHRETKPRITQDHLDSPTRMELWPAGPTRTLGILLFDEIEKGHPDVWQMLLGVLDKGTLVLGDNTKLTFQHTLLFFTSNLGSRDIAAFRTGGLGFSSVEREDVNQDIYKAAKGAMGKHFAPEFINRLDKMIVFHELSRADLHRILDVQLVALTERLLTAGKPLVLGLSDAAKSFLVEEGYEAAYGARHIKREIERWLLGPIARGLATAQIIPGDSLFVDIVKEGKGLDIFIQEQLVAAREGNV